MSTRRGDWIMTASGRKFWPFDPRPEDVYLVDIAHHLSQMCRFTGATREFYSVAQHCVHVSDNLSGIDAVYGLLHDASEAYICDIARPVKYDARFEFYRELERPIQATIYRAFGLDPAGESDAVRRMDRVMLRTEQRDLMPPRADDEDRDDAVPSAWPVNPWTPESAKHAFLGRARVLGIVRRDEFSALIK